MKQMKYVVAGAALLVGMAAAAQAATLDDVKARGKLVCGVTTGLAGFGAPNDKGEWAGLDIDLCKAVAAAVFGDATKVEYKPLSAEQRFTALQAGEVDVLARNSTWTLSRDTQLGLDFVGVNYYDGQGFMVRKDLGVSSALELKGATVCVQEGTTTEKNMGDFDKANSLGFEPVKFKENDQARSAYDEGRCDAYTTDASGLAGERTALKDPAAHIILPEIISKEPLGPVVRHGDNQWGDIVRWAHNATLVAEEKGITQANVDDVKAANGADNTAADAEIQRLLGITDKMGEGLGLSADWAYNIVKAVGNYGEIFDRNIGPNTPIGLERGLNALWTKGGLQYAPPVR
ncbi:general L-amino acid transport system substrate-binding protein [Dongia mobilis]|uniref:General L-amino acid transport system substrate-binding protein n=1 Tax=Dongia mobilis TaxID=578943 RepID=A0A4R6WH13_9PROT|nr:amino acid ABC transporter substrate-binding protein [Dongia mobilis]TDQ77601.1 general L-amino acid transport system substrate-binding protein [Dongia mobilis]